jgi:hypothetical protein
MKHAISKVAAAAVRKEPNHRSEMVNQLLFGETVHVLEEKDEWFLVKSLYDGYEGWLTYHLLAEVSEEVATMPLDYVAIGDLNIVLVNGMPMKIPMGSHLTGYNAQTGGLWTDDMQYLGGVKNTKGVFDGSSLVKWALHWHNAPYLWGAKTIMGIDCSGFAQTVFKLVGIKLLRDAWQQQGQGKEVKKLSSAREGDLAFFSNEQDRIVHVGIVMNNSQIIHASGRVRIDPIDEAGIVNSETGKRTHKLHSIRRMI